jgi:hypothetical protein
MILVAALGALCRLIIVDVLLVLDFGLLIFCIYNIKKNPFDTLFLLAEICSTGWA